VSPEQFLQFANVLPEPALLIAGNGVIHAANTAVEARLGVSRSHEARSRFAWGLAWIG
jgi:nitrogen-specific signal transduction histidine kinase